MSTAGIVVVGASLAGLRGAEAMRCNGYAGRLTLVGDEPHPPYDRPPLSKRVLSGELAPDATNLPQRVGLDANWRLGHAAVALDRIYGYGTYSIRANEYWSHDMTNEALLSPGRLGAIDVANRVAMAPLTRARGTMDGIQTPLAIEYYGKRASAGLIISEATNISRQGRGYAFTPGIYTDAQVEAWMPVTRAVHARGGKMVLQLWHVGRFSHVSLQENGAPPVAPSAIEAGDMVFTEHGFEPPSMPRELEAGEIDGIIADYVRAAENARIAGFDGVEVHAANCYLLEQFIRDSTNHRTDRYGGSVENRTRLPFEVCEAVARAIGADRVGIRLSPVTHAVGGTPFDSDPQKTYGLLAKRLGTLKLAYLHCIEGQTRGANLPESFDFQALRGSFGGAYIANNGFTREIALDATRSGRADMVAFGRPFISNPDLVERLRQDQPLAPEAPKEFFYGGGSLGYTDWPDFASQ